MEAELLLHQSYDSAGLAQDKSGVPAIQDLARQIARQDNDLLTGMVALAPQGGASSQGGTVYTAQLQRLSRVPSGDLFDDQYTGIQAGLAQQLAATFQTQSQSGNGPLKDFAAKALPGLQQIAAQSQALKKPQPAATP